MVQEKEFRLDDPVVVAAWQDYVKRLAAHEREADELEKIKSTFKRLAGDNDALKVGENKVASLIPGQLNRKLLAQEQPEIVKQYTKARIVEVFDDEAFAQELPEVRDMYRTKRLVLFQKHRQAGFSKDQ